MMSRSRAPMLVVSSMWIAPMLVASTLGCSGSEPRFASVTVSAAAPTATLSGRTSPTAVSAVELSPGCPGFVDPGSPEHLVRLEDATAIAVSARSLHGPLAIAVVGAGEVRCDADGGSGHAPHVTLDAPGEYLVYVGALAAPMDFAYELEIAPATTGASTSASASTRIGITVTSVPTGASVRTPEGEVLGTTPAMFVLPVSSDEMGRERRFIVELAGYQPAEVSGRLVGGTVVLHANLTPAVTVVDAPPPGTNPVVAVPAPGAVGSLLDTSVSVERPIRDYRTTTAAFDITGTCTIASVSVGIDVDHSYVGDLRVTVASPSGTEVVLRDHTGAGNAHLVSSYDATTLAALSGYVGQSATGRWEVRVRDDAGADTGTFHSASLRVACTETTGATAHGGRTAGGGGGGGGTRRPPPGGGVIPPFGGTGGGGIISGPVPPTRPPRSNGRTVVTPIP
jgi:subtilisin-like proprotein convertase family protein